MATRDEVNRALAGLPEASAAIVTEPAADGSLNRLAARTAAKGGGAVLVVLHPERAAGGSAINLSRAE